MAASSRSRIGRAAARPLIEGPVPLCFTCQAFPIGRAAARPLIEGEGFPAFQFQVYRSGGQLPAPSLKAGKWALKKTNKDQRSGGQLPAPSLKVVNGVWHDCLLCRIGRAAARPLIEGRDQANCRLEDRERSGGQLPAPSLKALGSWSEP